jgi:glutamate dehydrogenase/leucine dehydrogenase
MGRRFPLTTTPGFSHAATRRIDRLTAAQAAHSLGEQLQAAEHEERVDCRDHETGLRANTAVHETTPGEALCGTRMYDCRWEADTLCDALPVWRGTAFKAAENMDLGGSKSVIVVPRAIKRRDLLPRYGRSVEALAGHYAAGVFGTTATNDVDLMRPSTEFVVGSNSGWGDNGLSTAQGVFWEMQAGACDNFGSGGLVQVGSELIDTNDQGVDLRMAGIDARVTHDLAEDRGSNTAEASDRIVRGRRRCGRRGVAS